MTRKITAVGLIAVLLLSAVALPVNASTSLNYSDEGKAPNPYISVDSVTIDDWNNSQFDNPTQYYDDSGEQASLDATVNRSDDPADLGNGTVNPIALTATDIDVEEFSKFPRKGSEGDNLASALDASEWTTSGATMSDVTTAPGVTAVEYSGTDTANTSTYSNFSITSSVEKRYIQLAADVSSASGTPTFEVHDSDGDYVVIELYNSSADPSSASVLTNTTGEGMVVQTQVGQLTVKGSGDGTMGEMTKIVVSGDVNADFSLVNLEKTGEYSFGEEYVDSDSNSDDLETNTVREPQGQYRIHSVSTLGSAFDSASVKGLSFPADFRAQDLSSSDDVQSSFKKDNGFPNWDSVASIYYRMSLPSQYDVSYSGVSLVQTQRWTGSRYVSVELKESAGDTKFSEISNWNDKTGSFSNKDKTHTLDSTISVGTEYAVHVELKLTADEASAMQSGGGGGAAPMGDDSSGGFLDMLIGLPGLALAAIAGIVGRSQGWW